MYKERPHGQILFTEYMHCHCIIQQANTQTATFHFILEKCEQKQLILFSAAPTQKVHNFLCRVSFAVSVILVG
jgi:hypothetical protein